MLEPDFEEADGLGIREMDGDRMLLILFRIVIVK